MTKSPNPYIQHIIDSASQIDEYLQGVDNLEFSKNRLIQDAVVREIEIIGEACSKLEDNFKLSHPNVPWTQITAMRNKLTHEYWDIDLRLVWHTATVETPDLKKKLLDLLAQLGK